jgi:hypothetical protein
MRQLKPLMYARSVNEDPRGPQLLAPKNEDQLELPDEAPVKKASSVHNKRAVPGYGGIIEEEEEEEDEELKEGDLMVPDVPKSTKTSKQSLPSLLTGPVKQSLDQPDTLLVEVSNQDLCESLIEDLIENVCMIGESA